MNILVDSSQRARVADFGLSAVDDPQIRYWTSQTAVGSKGGTARWQAPELNGDVVVHNSKGSDIYAWSCVCYEVRGISPSEDMR